MLSFLGLTGALRADAGVVSVGSLTHMTEWASTSGTSNTWTGIPSWATEIFIMFDSVSLNGTDNVLLQLGDAGGIETTGYRSSLSTISTGLAAGNSTTGFFALSMSAGSIIQGAITLRKLSTASNTWVQTGSFGHGDAAQTQHIAGSKTLSDVLTQLKVLTSGGTVAFDLGTINVAYR